jgi:hypothetical protein
MHNYKTKLSYRPSNNSNANKMYELKPDGPKRVVFPIQPVVPVVKS